MPISLSTPSRMSLMTSGGMRSERISDRASGRMFPTARFASSTRGCRAAMERTGEEREGQVCVVLGGESHLHFLHLVVDVGFSLFNLGNFLSHLPFDLLHFRLLVTGILGNHKRSSDIYSVMFRFIHVDQWIHTTFLRLFYVFSITFPRHFYEFSTTSLHIFHEFSSLFYNFFMTFPRLPQIFHKFSMTFL